ncbi:S8 family serine peptidase [Microcoleus vaginatus]|uniref:S8 family serine peptidase n=1 Tax=Microcoleus vaginatus TaxID=119532 RepID=UPI00168A0D36|nr:S8 family serine peptidase [Microcoleus sp. FACHB-84]MBD2009539.1 S8 family serine peptidase [Microcoleus sp. FACHB-45]
MLDIKTNPNDRPFFIQQPNAIATSAFPVNNDLPNRAIDPFNVSSYSAESSFPNLPPFSTDQQAQTTDFILPNASAGFSYSVSDAQLKPQSQSAIANTDPLTGTRSASQLNFADPGNSLSTARNVVGVQNGSISLTDFVGVGDSNDFYRFDINTKSNFNLRLDGLRGEVKLIQDRNRNRVVDLGETIDSSANSGKVSDVINVPNLAPGTYYVEVYTFSGSTNYNLNLSATSVPVVPDITTPNGVYNSNYGYGLVNANAAVSSTLNRSSLLPALPDLGGTNWALDVINAPEVGNQNITGNGIVVAVVDSGVDYTHPDLDGNIWRNAGEIAGNGIDDDRNGYIDDIRGWDFVSNDNNPMDLDFYGHGTHVAGSIAAERNNFGITGVAPNAKIMPLRVLPAFGRGEWNNVAAGIRYAADNGANVINLSLGNELYPLNQVNDAIQYAIQYANNKGSVVVMSAGNLGEIQPGYPARNADSWGIAVGSIDVSGRMDDSSNRSGSRPLDYLVAPGVEIFSTTPDDDYEIETGTSFATPQVAGVAALVLNANPTLTPAQVEYILTTTANRNGLTG